VVESTSRSADNQRQLGSFDNLDLMKSDSASRTPVTPVTARGNECRVIFLVGFMGAGKTSVGKSLARRLGWQFEDLDKRIETREANNIEQIFRTTGEPAFRIMEQETIRELLRSVGSSRHVVALGGGAFAQQASSDMIRRSGFPVVFLDAPVEELWRRCREQAIQRPLARDLEQFRNLYQARRSYYEKAGLRVETYGKNVEAVAAEVACSLGLE
jgi:shikimate kinase